MNTSSNPKNPRLCTPGPQKRTAGPWKAVRVGSCHYVHTLAIGEISPYVCKSGRADERVSADFKLLAEAPRMLQLLQNIAASAPLTGLPLALEKDIQEATIFLARVDAV